MTSPEPDELDDDLYPEVLRLCALGDDLAEGDLDAAADELIRACIE